MRWFWLLIIIIFTTTGCLSSGGAGDNANVNKTDLILNDSSLLINMDKDVVRNGETSSFVGDISSGSDVMNVFMSSNSLVDSADSATFFSNSDYLFDKLGFDSNKTEHGLVVEAPGYNNIESKLKKDSNLSVISSFIYNGYRIVEVDRKTTDDRVFISNIEKGNIAITNKEKNIKEMIDNAYSGNDLSNDLVNELISGNNMVFKSPGDELNTIGLTEGRIEMDTFMAEYSISEERVSYRGRMDLRSEESAKNLEESIGYTLLASSTLGGKPLSKVLNNIKIKRQESIVIIKYIGNPDDVINVLDKIKGGFDKESIVGDLESGLLKNISNNSGIEDMLGGE